MDLVNAMIRFSRFDEFFESEEVDAHTSTHTDKLSSTHTHIYTYQLSYTRQTMYTQRWQQQQQRQKQQREYTSCRASFVQIVVLADSLHALNYVHHTLCMWINERKKNEHRIEMPIICLPRRKYSSHFLMARHRLELALEHSWLVIFLLCLFFTSHIRKIAYVTFGWCELWVLTLLIWLNKFALLCVELMKKKKLVIFLL